MSRKKTDPRLLNPVLSFLHVTIKQAWIASANVVSHVEGLAVQASTIEEWEVWITNFDKMRTESADGVFADVGDALRDGRPEEASDVHEVDVDEERRNTAWSKRHGT